MDTKADEILNTEKFNLIDLVILFMEEAETMLLNGRDKKVQVIFFVKTAIVGKWGVEFYNKYEPIVPILIEFIIAVSHKEVIIKINKKIKKYCLCI